MSYLNASGNIGPQLSYPNFGMTLGEPFPASLALPICGPDATDWFIRQVAAAKTSPAVLAVKTILTLAARLGVRMRVNASAIAEGAVAFRVLQAETAAGNPPRTRDASAQIAAAAPGLAALFAMGAFLPSTTAPVGSAALLGLIGSAALGWKALVQTGAVYDFKNHPETMRNPRSLLCPGCPNTITLCPSTGSDCFQTDVPGNLFYAHLGKFVGWTELVLQLGSQFAQLASSRWDPREDTRAISVGFNLPHPLTRAGLCAALTSHRSDFVLRRCANCPEQTRAAVV